MGRVSQTVLTIAVASIALWFLTGCKEEKRAPGSGVNQTPPQALLSENLARLKYLAENGTAVQVKDYYNSIIVPRLGDIPLSSRTIPQEEALYYVIKREYEDARGIVHKVKLQLIKGLKFDSALIEMILNRKMSDVFTRSHLDFPNLILLIILIATLITSIVNIGLHFLA